MTVEINPYKPPAVLELTQSSKGSHTHRVGDRSFEVSARYLPRSLWLLGGVSIQLDDGTTYTASKAAVNDRIEWTMQLNGAPVTCKLETQRTIVSHFSLPYRVSVGKHFTDSHSIKPSGAWACIVVQIIGITLLCLGIMGLGFRSLR